MLMEAIIVGLFILGGIIAFIIFKKKSKKPEDISNLDHIDPEIIEPPIIQDVLIIPDNSDKLHACATICWNSKNIPGTEFVVSFKPETSEKWETKNTSKSEIKLDSLSKGVYYEFNIQSIINGKSSQKYNKKYYFTNSTLNEQQQNAVSHTSKTPLMVIAGPGTGKTHVILERVKDLILNQDLDPDKILCLTFNKKAQEEMNQRIKDDKDLKSQNKSRLGYVKTYNSFAYQFSSTKMDLISIKKWFDQKLTETTFEHISNDYDTKKEFIEKIQMVIGAFRKELCLPKQLKEYCEQNRFETIRDSDTGKERRITRPEILELLELHELYDSYLNYLTINKNNDYDDQLIDCDKNLSSINPVNNNTWLDHFDHILVDEYQDNNYLHTKIAKLLSSTGNVTVVGDPDQTINTFQGANTANFDDFKNHFEKIKKIKHVNLIENYRSTGNIILTANHLISKIHPNRRQELFTRKIPGEKIQIISCDNFNMNCDFVLKEIKNIIENENYDYLDFAILCRTNKTAKLCYDYFKNNKFPVNLKNKLHANIKKSDSGSVTIGTVHHFKGLEYKGVFVLDVSEGVFPIPFKSDSLKVPIELRHYKPKLNDIEEHKQEERRIFYVALTRAKEKLFFVSSDPIDKLSGFLQEFEVFTSNFKKTTYSPTTISTNTNDTSTKLPDSSSKKPTKMSRDEFVRIQMSAGIDLVTAGKEWDAKNET